MQMIKDLSLFQRIIALILSLFLIIGIFLVFLWIIIQYQVGSTIYPYTYVDDIDMGLKTKEEALKQLKKRDDYYSKALIEVFYKNQKVATFSGTQLHLARDIESKVDQAHLVGRSTDISSRIAQQLNSVFHIKKYSFKTRIRYDEELVNLFIENMEESYNRPPQDALFKFEDGKVAAFRPHKKGNKILSEDFIVNVNNEIQRITEKSLTKTIEILEEPVNPDITLAEANTLGIETLIGEGVSDYSHSIPGRVFNVILAASKFHGIIIQKNETFSFNRYVGDISTSSGYQQAYIIKNGRTVLGDGGGVCQVSTTMFRAALNTGLPIVSRTAHAYRVSYYENDSQPGFDATIFTPSVDLTFKNDTPGAILIQTEVDKDNNILRFKFYGQSDGRKVQISPVSIWDVVPPPEPKYEDDPTQPNGAVKQVDFPAWGSKVRFGYKVFDKHGNIMIDTNFLSVYRPWQAVFLKGTGG